MSTFVNVLDYGTDSATIQKLIHEIALKGEGTGIFFPAGFYKLDTPLIIRKRTWLFGQSGDVTFLQMQKVDGLHFDIGPLEARIEKLRFDLVGDPTAQVGIKLVQTQRVIIDSVQIWGFDIGMQLSDGMPFSGYNAISHFLVAACRVGIQATTHCNNTSVRDGRVLGPNTASSIGIEVLGGAAVEFDAVTSEGSGLQVQVTGEVKCAFTNCYFESFDPASPRIFDIQPDVGLGKETTVIFKGNHSSAEGRFLASPDALLETDTNGTTGRWAARHPAASTGRNLVRNGDLHLWRDVPITIPNWASSGTLTVQRETNLKVTAKQSMRVSAGDFVDPQATVSCGFQCPDVIGSLTVGIRFMMIEGTAPWVILSAGVPNPFVPLPDGPVGVWREEFITGPALANSPGSVTVVPFQAGSANLVIDEIWVVPGRVAAASRAYGERVERLEQPQLLWELVNAGEGAFPLSATPIDLAEPPTSAWGVLLRLEAQLGPGNGVAFLEVNDANVQSPRCYSVVSGQLATQDVSVRHNGTLSGQAVVEIAGATASFRVWLLGWILV